MRVVRQSQFLHILEEAIYVIQLKNRLRAEKKTYSNIYAIFCFVKTESESFRKKLEPDAVSRVESGKAEIFSSEKA